MALNKFICTGRLVADPEMRRTSSGTAVCTFALAVERDYKNKTGKYDADFPKFIAWDKLAERVKQYFVKGKMAHVVGRFSTRKYEVNGEKKTTNEFILENIYFAEK